MAPLVHLELLTADASAARALYGELCGWRSSVVDTSAGTYLALELGRLGGGIVESAAPRPVWLPYVGVDDIVGATARAQRLGASLLLPPREGPAGWRSVVASPAGGALAFWQQKR